MSNAKDCAPAACVYCLHNGHFSDEQVLWRGDYFYLCAPRGQMIEGFLAIAPYVCAGALAKLPDSVFGELISIQARVRRFYATVYHTTAAIFYEQGRGGGCARTDSAGRFPLHAHLCSLPAAVDLHAVLGRNYLPLPAPEPGMLTKIVAGKPYLYVETCGLSAAYVSTRDDQIPEIARARLKPIVAKLMGIAERGDWRSYPGERELRKVIKKWRRHCETQA